MDIKEIMLKIADSLRNKIDGISHMQSNQGLVGFAEALIAELAKQNEPVAWWNGKETAFFEHETDGPVGEVRIPLYALPPTAPQIEQRVAEACALLEEATSYTSCETWSPSLTDEINKFLKEGE